MSAQSILQNREIMYVHSPESAPSQPLAVFSFQIPTFCGGDENDRMKTHAFQTALTTYMIVLFRRKLPDSTTLHRRSRVATPNLFIERPLALEAYLMVRQV